MADETNAARSVSSSPCAVATAAGTSLNEPSISAASTIARSWEASSFALDREPSVRTSSESEGSPLSLVISPFRANKLAMASV